MQVCIQMPVDGRHTRGRSTVTREAILKHIYTDGTCKVQFKDPVETVDNFLLDAHQWQISGSERLEALVAAMPVTPASKYFG